jgi:hypothetical protein
LATTLSANLEKKDQEQQYNLTLNEKLTHELTLLKRHRFSRRSEQLDYTPGEFAVERHVRGKWVCEHCETLIQALVTAQVIDKGIPTRWPSAPIICPL